MKPNIQPWLASRRVVFEAERHKGVPRTNMSMKGDVDRGNVVGYPWGVAPGEEKERGEEGLKALAMSPAVVGESRR